MGNILCYTSPARGHLFPTVPMLLELRHRGHQVSVITLGEEVARMEQAGLRARALHPKVEAIAHDDYRARSPLGAISRAIRVFARRAEHEIPDLQRAVEEERPHALLVDYNCWGAAAVAEKSGLPWAMFMPYFLPWRLPGRPPFGPGLSPRRDWVGRLRDRVVGGLSYSVFNRNLPLLNQVRARVGVAPLSHLAELGRSAPRLLYYTAEPFEYPNPHWPANVVPVGPGRWDPPASPPPWLSQLSRPLVLVTCSTEYQGDAKLIAVALEGLAAEELSVVATAAAQDAGQFAVPANARVEPFVPHQPLLERAACVVCHGGMGITQKALAAGVPVVVVPFGRDQAEVARRVEVAGAGVRLPPGRLSPRTLREAVRRARAMTEGAQRVAEAFRASGGASRAADALESLLGAPSSHPVAGSGGAPALV